MAGVDVQKSVRSTMRMKAMAPILAVCSGARCLVRWIKDSEVDSRFGIRCVYLLRKAVKNARVC